jgi:hypothetical protein
MSTPMSRAERRTLSPLAISENPTDRLSLERPGENPVRKIDKYLPFEATLKEGAVRTPRTDRAARFILRAAQKNGGEAPYAFILPHGDPSSLDWGVVSFLWNAGEIDFNVDGDGFVTGVVPRPVLWQRYGQSETIQRSSANPSLTRDINAILTESQSSPTERAAEILARVGQGQFRNQLMKTWGGACAVTGCEVPELLRASHILPWHEWGDHRLNSCNGLLLVAHLDAAFDAYLISFDEFGTLILSARIPVDQATRLGLEGRLRKLPPKQTREFLAVHRAEMRRRDGNEISF